MYGGTHWPYGTIRPLLVGLALAGETALWLALSRFGSRPGLFFVLFFYFFIFSDFLFLSTWLAVGNGIQSAGQWIVVLMFRWDRH